MRPRRSRCGRRLASADSISIQTKYHQREESWQNRHHRGAEVEYTITVPRNARLDEIKLINGELDIIGVSGEVRASLKQPEVVAKLSDLGLTTIGSAPEELAAYLKREIDAVGSLARAIGLEPE